MDIQAFDYHLPQDRIPRFPAPRRDESRLLVLERDTGKIHHCRFRELVSWMAPGDLLVVNDTRVIPARLRGRKATGGRVEVLLCEPISPDGSALPPVETSGAFRTNVWRCVVRPRGRLRDGVEILLRDGVKGVLHGQRGDEWYIEFSGVEDLREWLESAGEPPLPPYLKRAPVPLDRERYQTMFARRDGSIAAPTAGLHFTPEILRRLEERGAHRTAVTLQVGVGTFLPVSASHVEEHRMHPEYVEVTDACCRAWEQARGSGGKVVAAGTTTVRALESAVDEEGRPVAFHGFTSLFILPGFRFRAVDALITNFHLPRSTLLMLVMAFAGGDAIKKAYDEAIQAGYRFASYGDAMLIR